MINMEKIMKAQSLVAKMYSINATVAGMTAFNQSRISREESPGYSECDFFGESEKLDAIAKAFENLI